jgi:protein-tyrosine phosphatase
VQVRDITAPTPEQLEEMAQFISAEAQRGIVYVHCKIGYSRSAAAVAAYLLMSGQVATVEEALALLRKVRPSIVVRAEIVEALVAFTRRSFSSRFRWSAAANAREQRNL